MNPPRLSSTDADQPQTHSDEYEHGWLARLVGRLFGRQREVPVPADLASQVTVLGIENARFWADSQGAALAHEAERALEREKAAPGKTEGGHLPPAQFLAISGSSDRCAFGDGLICGWSDAGTMPTFKLVTGVSTGAMIAPFAFLGRSYMDGLRAVYTTIGPGNVLKRLGIQNAVFGEALADTAPLYELITRYV